MKKPRIALTADIDSKTGALFSNPGYWNAILDAGGMPYFVAPAEKEEDIKQIIRDFDGFFFTGGDDLDPACYGEEKLPCCGDICSRRDRFELTLARLLSGEDKPVFAVCKGIQVLNVALGGSLYQDVQAQNAANMAHNKVPAAETAHFVAIQPNTLLAQIIPEQIHWVNSRHHQNVKSPAPAVQICAYSSDGLIESICLPDKTFFLGVQWHPEFLYRTNREEFALFQRFVSSCSTD